MIVNCDIGERGEHPIDIKLMNYIGLANIACGGHAGDKRSVEFFLNLAKKNFIAVSAHLSYPDRENFGRVSMTISYEELGKSLQTQYSLINSVKTVKFHGALYNDANRDKNLANFLADWMQKNKIIKVVTQFDSELALAAKNRGIIVLNEAFAERNYTYDEGSKRVALVPRTRDYASITSIDEAIKHSKKIIVSNLVSAYIENSNQMIKKDIFIKADTICIHSESEISLELAKRLCEL